MFTCNYCGHSQAVEITGEFVVGNIGRRELLACTKCGLIQLPSCYLTQLQEADRHMKTASDSDLAIASADELLSLILR